MILPSYRHIHCSSRGDRSAASLESDLDDWMDRCGLITLTEVSNDRRAATMREKNWAYANAKKDNGADECGIAWSTQDWHKERMATRKLTNAQFYRLNGKPARSIHSLSVLLKRIESKHRLLVSVTHLPAHVEGRDQWRTDTAKWRARKQAYLSSLTNWSTHVRDLERKWSPDGVMVVADWNMNLKDDWASSVLATHFHRYQSAWVRFPTEGGSMTGGPTAPLGSPGVSKGDRIIDGTFYRGLKVNLEPNLLSRQASSDHRPYLEGFRFKDPAEQPDQGGPHGDNQHQDAWWGFGDYLVDELYEVSFAEGEAGGEVL